MSLSVNFSQTSVSAQFLYASSGQGTSGAGPVVQPEHRHHKRVLSGDDQLTLSSAAQRPQRIHREHDDDDQNSMSALDKLVSHLVRTMLKSMLGQGFQLQDPGQAPQQGSGAPATSEATDAPAAASNAVDASSTDNLPVATTPSAAATPAATNGPVGNAVAAYYQVQSFSFDANASVSTEDGQQLGISVHFSFSQQFYSAVGLAGSTGNSATGASQQAGTTAATPQAQPASNPFQGLAAQLTQTSFSFEVDMEGQPQAADSTATVTPSATNGGAKPPTTATTPLNVQNPVASPSDDTGQSILEQLDKLFEKMQVWLKHPEGGRQLVAIGINSSMARYVGNLADAAPSAAQPSQAEQTGTATSGNAQDKTDAVNVVA